MNFEELWKLLRTEHIQRDKYYRLSIASYQLGDVHKAVVYQQYYGSVGSHAESKIAISDLIAQIHLLCLTLNLDYDKLQDLGLKRLAEFVSRRMASALNRS